MRVICLDVGTKTIGVAMSDPLGIIAQGLTTIRRETLEHDLDAVSKMINEHDVEEVIVGLPLNMNGSNGPSVDMAKAFGEALRKIVTASIIYRDERLSTVAAQRTLLEGDVSRKKRKQVIDKMAAAYVLQGYLDSKQ